MTRKSKHSRRWAGAAPLVLAFCLLGCGHADGTAAGPFSTLVGLYRGPLNHLSAVRSGTCPMHPSCSEYARQSVAKHGELAGWVMSCDRLLRCGRDEVRRSPMVQVGDGFRIADPVERNDFWWAAPRPVFSPIPETPGPAAETGAETPARKINGGQSG